MSDGREILLRAKHLVKESSRAMDKLRGVLVTDLLKILLFLVVLSVKCMLKKLRMSWILQLKTVLLLSV